MGLMYSQMHVTITIHLFVNWYFKLLELFKINS